MRILLLFTLTLLLASGCQKDDEFSGTDNDGDRLVRFAVYYESEEQHVSNYVYNEQNQIINDHFLRYGIVEGTRYYTYDQSGRMSQRLVLQQPPYDDIQVKVNFIYDEENRLVESIGWVSFDAGVTFEEPDRHRTKYYYDEQGDLHRKETVFSDSVDLENSWEYTEKDIYYEWENGNIVKEEWYNTQGVKSITKLYEYDNKLNYRIIQPDFFIFPENMTQNNFVKERLIDHLGFYPSVACTNCTINYKYNRSGMPVSYYYPSTKERVFKLTYE